jgi:hypothetical protein
MYFANMEKYQVSNSLQISIRVSTLEASFSQPPLNMALPTPPCHNYERGLKLLSSALLWMTRNSACPMSSDPQELDKAGGSGDSPHSLIG